MGMVLFDKSLCDNNLVRISTNYSSEKNGYFEPIFPNLPDKKGQIVGIFEIFENSINTQMIPVYRNE